MVMSRSQLDESSKKSRVASRLGWHRCGAVCCQHCKNVKCSPSRSSWPKRSSQELRFWCLQTNRWSWFIFFIRLLLAGILLILVSTTSRVFWMEMIFDLRIFWVPPPQPRWRKAWRCTQSRWRRFCRRDQIVNRTVSGRYKLAAPQAERGCAMGWSGSWAIWENKNGQFGILFDL